jgi:hypothetical protein
MRDRLKWLLLCVAFVVVMARLTTSTAAEDETLVVIVHPSVRTGDLSMDELVAIFTLSERTWPGGQTIVPFNYAPHASWRDSFDRMVLGMTADEAAHFWIDRRVRGGGDAPRKVTTVALMVRVVAALPGAIGYVPASAPITGVKVVARVSGGKILRMGGR